MLYPSTRNAYLHVTLSKNFFFLKYKEVIDQVYVYNTIIFLWMFNIVMLGLLPSLLFTSGSLYLLDNCTHPFLLKHTTDNIVFSLAILMNSCFWSLTTSLTLGTGTWIAAWLFKKQRRLSWNFLKFVFTFHTKFEWLWVIFRERYYLPHIP